MASEDQTFREITSDPTLATDPALATAETLMTDRPRPAAAADLPRGSVVGRYVILDKLASGGMGVVYAAYDPELDRKVALKLLHVSASGEKDVSAGRSRLFREAQAMAKLTHPNVITVHDVGPLGDRVFIAMEFIEGSTLTKWMAQEARDWQGVLQPFLAAGQGIAAAHRAGVVHRDFKPDNVMVGNDGRVCVLDFGLARPLGDPTTSSEELPDEAREAAARSAASSVSGALGARLTVTGAVMGTPAYMAPEQHLGKPVDERSDQFSFCVALYEALYGQRPFTGDSQQAIAFQVCQGRIRPAPKGVRLPAWLRRVVLRGLEPAPDDRFPNMEHLLAALGRDPGRTRRRVLGIAAAGSAVVAGGLGLWHVENLRAESCRHMEGRLEGVWDESLRSAAGSAFTATAKPYAAESWGRVESSLADYARAWVDMRTEVCEQRSVQSDQLVGLRLRCLDRRRERLGSLAAVLAEADSSVVLNAVAAVEELPDVETCADLEALQRGIPPPDDEETRVAVEDLRRRLAEAETYNTTGRYDEARVAYAKLADEARALGYRPALAEVLLQQSDIEMTSGDAESAHTVLEEGLWMAEASGHDHIVAQSWLGLGFVRAYGLSRFDDAWAALRRASAAVERIGSPSGAKGDLLRIEAIVHRLQSGHGESEAKFREALPLVREALGADHPEVASLLQSLAGSVIAEERYEEALTLLDEAEAIIRDKFGPNHPRLAHVLHSKARARRGQNRPDEALALARESVEIVEQAFGTDHADLGAMLNGVGLLQEDAEGEEAALATYERALDLVERLRGSEHAHTATLLNNLARVTTAVGRYEESLRYGHRNLDLKRKIYGDDHVEVAHAHDLIGDTLVGMGRHEDALVEYRTSLAHYDGDEVDADAGYPLAGMGEAYLGLGKVAKAVELLERALALEHGDASEATRAAFVLARALWKTGERDRALELARGARKGLAERGKRRRLAEVDAWLDRVGSSKR